MIYFQSLTRDELANLIKPLSRVKRKPSLSELEIEKQLEKQATYRAKQVFQWVYQRFVTDWDQMTDQSKDLRAWLKANVEIYRLKENQSHQALDGTHKFLWSLGDSKTIESVIIPAALQEKNDEIEDPEDAEGNPEHFSGKAVSDGLSSNRWSRLTACISSQVGCAMA